MRRLRYAIAVCVITLVIGTIWVYETLHGSLPRIDGDLVSAQLSHAVTIERDGAGVPTVHAESRADLAFATGFLHAQDRFFQMDLMRRSSAGELAELFGPKVVDLDKRVRVHDFRSIATQVLLNETAETRAIVKSYTAGVNFGLAQLSRRPWEYLLLRQHPQLWKSEDCVLVAFAMYLDLNDFSGEKELQNAHLRSALPPQLFEFLTPSGTEWDAPLSGDSTRIASTIPGPDIVNLRTQTRAHNPPDYTDESDTAAPLDMAGSNSWAVAGSQTVGGAALLASDMHLRLSLPHTWYRARLVVETPRAERDLVGVTLPGLPLVIIGSNRHVAWGGTNSFGDFTDLVVIQVDPNDPNRYLTPNGYEKFKIRKEVIQVGGEKPITIEVQTTRWGPVVNHDDLGRPMALAWTAHDPAATNFHMLDFETAQTVDEVIEAANHAGGPVQSLIVADSVGHIGWTFLGQVPVRSSYNSSLPTAWHTPGSGWQGWREPEEYPRIIDPPSGRLWTANNRTIDVSSWSHFVGGTEYDLGARAAQIRDGLLALPRANALDMCKIQLDDRASFLLRWRNLLLELLDDDALTGHPLRAKARHAIATWSGRAAVDDRGYPIVRRFRSEVQRQVFRALTAPAHAKYPKDKFNPSTQFEGPLWQVITAQPAHLLDPNYSSWKEWLLTSLDIALSSLSKQCLLIENCKWGDLNVLDMKHPLSGALPFASKWLNMPKQALPGDSYMPRVQSPGFGASERLIVSPGHEAEGYFNMPGSQTDHPLSPFYGIGHSAWVRGDPTPLLPGETRHTLRLVPKS